MRVAGFTRLMPSHRGVGGMQGHAQNLYRGLVERGHEVHVFTTSNANKKPIEDEAGVVVHYIPGTKPATYTETYYKKSAEEFNKFHKKNKFDVIHTESTAARTLRGGKVPVVATWHGVGYCGFRDRINIDMASGRLEATMKDFNQRWSGIFGKIIQEVISFHRYDYHIAISDQAYEDLLTVYKIPKNRVFLVYNGFSTKQFKIDRQVGKRIRAKYGIPNDAFVVGVGGRLTVEKGHRLLIKVLPSLLKKHADLYCLVVGKGNIEGEYKRLQNPKLMYVGPQPYEDMPKFYNAMDVFVNPTMNYHGLDMVMQEAMLCGLPLVATDTGSIKRSVICDNKFGIAFELGNVRALSKAITAMKTKDCRKMGSKGREFIKARCSLDQMCKGMEKVFKHAVEKGSIPLKDRLI